MLLRKRGFFRITCFALIASLWGSADVNAQSPKVTYSSSMESFITRPEGTTLIQTAQPHVSPPPAPAIARLHCDFKFKGKEPQSVYDEAKRCIQNSLEKTHYVLVSEPGAADLALTIIIKAQSRSTRKAGEVFWNTLFIPVRVALLPLAWPAIILEGSRTGRHAFGPYLLTGLRFSREQTIVDVQVSWALGGKVARYRFHYLDGSFQESLLDPVLERLNEIFAARPKESKLAPAFGP